MPDQLESIVQRMIDAGEPEENIASVIREYKPQEKAPSMAAPAVVAAGLGTLKAAPAVVSGVNTAANLTRGVPPLIGGRWPAIAEIIAHLTGPIGGPIATGAKAVSEFAGAAALPAAIVSAMPARAQVETMLAQPKYDNPIESLIRERLRQEMGGSK